MSRYSYAGGAADFVFDVAPNGYLRLRPATLLVYAAENAGARVNDLLLNGQPVTTIPVDDTGQVPDFQGPDNFDGDLWVATGPDRPRIRLISNAESSRAEVAAATATAAAESVADLAGLIAGYVDHGNVSGAVAIDPTIGTHVLDATAATTLTIGDADNGVIVTVLPVTGAADVSVSGIVDLELTDDTFATFARIRDAWRLAAAGAGGTPATPDTTPPSPVTDLAATPGDDGDSVTLTFTAATDAESTVKYRARIYPTGESAPAWPTSGALYNRTGSPVVAAGLDSGTAYTAELHAYSAGGASAYDSALFTTPASLSTVLNDTFTQTNGEMGSRVADTGQTWVGSTSSAQIQSNRMHCGTAEVRINAGAAPREITFDAYFTGAGYVAVSPWSTAGSNTGTRALITQGGQVGLNNIGVTYNADGTTNDYTPGGFITFALNTPHAIKVVYDGSTVALFIEGTRIIEGVPLGTMTNTYVGATGDLVGFIDNLSVKANS